jgi:hypothetical protein
VTDVHRTLAGGLAASRLVFGALNLVRPASAQLTWIGRAARKPGTQVMIRSQGARDLALGLGTLWALREGRDAHAWMVAQVITDGADGVATWIAREDLPRVPGRAALAAAVASTAVAAVAAAGLRRANQPTG